jgi:asparagine synthase (glutamine-hydrolysing)
VTDVAWLAAHAAVPLDPERVQAWLTGVEHALEARVGDMQRDFLLGRHIGLVAWWDPENAPQGWSQTETSPGGLAVLDGYPIGFEHLGLDRPSPLGIATALSRDPSLASRLLAPVASVAIQDGSLSVTPDALGFASIYRAQHAGMTVWSNSPALCALFAFGRVSPSPEGWTSLLSEGRFLGDGGPLQGVRRLAPGERVSVIDSPVEPREIRSDVFRPLLDEPVAPDAVAPAVVRAITDAYQSLAKLEVGSVRVPLSGGRDSRVLAAVALAQNIASELWTSSPPELDVVIAEELLALTDGSVPWVRTNKSERIRGSDAAKADAGRTADDTWASAVSYQFLGEGQDEVTPQTVRSRPQKQIHDVALWGLGGEFARSFYYHEDALAAPEARVESFWRSVRTGPGLVDVLARRDLLAPRVDGIRSDLEAQGVRGLSQLDVLYVFERTRRFKARTGNTAGVWPYLTYGYIKATLGQTPEWRVHTRYYEDVVRLVFPAWSGRPYAHELKAENREAASAGTHADAYWDSPFIRPLGELLMDHAATEDLLVNDELRRLLTAGGRRDGWAVTRMRRLNQVINYLSYREHVTQVQAAFTAAGGVQVGEIAGPLPVESFQIDRGRARLRRALANTAFHVSRVARLGRRFLKNPRQTGRQVLKRFR